MRSEPVSSTFLWPLLQFPLSNFCPSRWTIKLEAEINLFLPSGFWSWVLSLEIKQKEIIFYLIKHFKEIFFIRRCNCCNHTFIMLKQKSRSASIFCTLVAVLTFLVRQLASPRSKLVSPWTHEETDHAKKGCHRCGTPHPLCPPHACALGKMSSSLAAWETHWAVFIRPLLYRSTFSTHAMIL